MNFESLVGRINLIQDALQAQAAHAVNLSLPTAKLQTEDFLTDEKLRLSHTVPGLCLSLCDMSLCDTN